MNTVDSPSGDPTAHNQQTYDRIAPAYRERQLRHRAEGHQGFDAFEQSFLDALPGGGVVADLGCGPALDAGGFAERGLRAVAMDRSRGMLALAPAALRGKVAQADMRSLPLAPGALDGIWCCAALLHVPEEQTSLVIGEFRRALRARGRLGLITAVGAGSRFEAVEYEPGERRWFVYRRAEDITGHLTGAGFHISVEERVAGNRDWLVTLCTAS